MRTFFARGRYLAPVIAAVIAAAPAAATCVKPGGGGGCSASIQAAVDAAPGGGTVYVHPGTYHEAVTIAKPGIRLVGTGRTPGQVRIDGLGLDAVGIAVSAPNVGIRNLTVRTTGRSGILVEAGGSGVALTRVRVAGADDFGIRVEAPGARLLACKVTGSSWDGISVAGDDAVVSRCALAGTMGVEISGSPGRVVATTVVASHGGSGILVRGAAVAVRDCTVRNVPEHGILVDGPAVAPQVLDNEVAFTGSSGIRVQLSGAGAVSGNTVRESIQGPAFLIACEADCGDLRVLRNLASQTSYLGSCFEISSTGPEGPLVRYNRALDCGRHGFAIEAVGVAVRDNTARGGGMASGYTGFLVNGSRAVVSGNVSERSGHGFVVWGDDLVVRGNLATGNTRHGFQVGSIGSTARALIEDNVALGNLLRGIFLDATVDASVLGSTARGNGEYDFFDGGSGTSLGAGNHFGTTGP